MPQFIQSPPAHEMHSQSAAAVAQQTEPLLHPLEVPIISATAAASGNYLMQHLALPAITQSRVRRKLPPLPQEAVTGMLMLPAVLSHQATGQLRAYASRRMVLAHDDVAPVIGRDMQDPALTEFFNGDTEPDLAAAAMWRFHSADTDRMPVVAERKVLYKRLGYRILKLMGW